MSNCVKCSMESMVFSRCVFSFTIKIIDSRLEHLTTAVAISSRLLFDNLSLLNHEPFISMFISIRTVYGTLYLSNLNVIDRERKYWNCSSQLDKDFSIAMWLRTMCFVYNSFSFAHRTLSSFISFVGATNWFAQQKRKLRKPFANYVYILICNWSDEKAIGNRILKRNFLQTKSLTLFYESAHRFQFAFGSI